MCCSGINHDKEKSPLKGFNDGRFSLCTDGCVDILRIVCGPRSAPDAFHPRQTLSETLNWSVSRVLTNLRRNNAAMSGPGTSRWGWVRGLCCRGGGGTAGLVLWGDEDRGVALWQRNNENPTTPTLTDAFAPCIKTPLAGSHLFFIPSLFASQTIEWFGWLGLGRGTVGPYKIKALLFFLYFMRSTKNLKLCCSFNLSFFFYY